MHTEFGKITKMLLKQVKKLTSVGKLSKENGVEIESDPGFIKSVDIWASFFS